MMFNLDTFRAWWGGALGPLQQCDSADVERIAADLCLSPSELGRVARCGGHRRDLLLGMMAAKALDPTALNALYPGVMRSVEVSCSLCPNARRCARELARGTAALNAEEFCSNALTFDALAIDSAGAAAPAA